MKIFFKVSAEVHELEVQNRYYRDSQNVYAIEIDGPLDRDWYKITAIRINLQNKQIDSHSVVFNNTHYVTYDFISEEWIKDIIFAMLQLENKYFESIDVSLYKFCFISAVKHYINLGNISAEIKDIL